MNISMMDTLALVTDIAAKDKAITDYGFYYYLKGKGVETIENMPFTVNDMKNYTIVLKTNSIKKDTINRVENILDKLCDLYGNEGDINNDIMELRGRLFYLNKSNYPITIKD